VTTHDDGPPFDPELMAAVTDLGVALRELIDSSVRTTVPAEEIRATAVEVRTATARLAASRRPLSQLPPLDDPAEFRRVYNPVSGIGSALAPPLVIRRSSDGVVADVTLGAAYEGPPGYVHGGMTSLLMDQLLGAAAMAADKWGMTARLELDYRRPVPLATPLALRAWIIEDAGRKTGIAGSIALAGSPDQVLVEARGIFVAPRPELIDAYFGSVTDATGQHRPPRSPTDATAVQRD
jgi:acyl-coenzyme A thioesterase PaaI-like protein